MVDKEDYWEIYILDEERGLIYTPQANSIWKIERSMAKKAMRGKGRHFFVKKENRFGIDVEAIEKKAAMKTKVKFDPCSILLDNVYVLIAQRCNLRCIYCYGDAGRYGCTDPAKEIMDIPTAKKTIDALVKNPKIRWSENPRIVFFGGEPFLNFKVMKALATEFKTHLPNVLLDVVTNGTILTDEMIEFMKKYDMGVAVSLDGPREIHDKQRIFPNMEGSFPVVMKSISKLREAGIRIAVESTLTSLCHYPSKIYDYLKHLKIASYLLAPVRCSKDSLFVITYSDDVIEDFVHESQQNMEDIIRGEQVPISGVVSQMIGKIHTNYLSSYVCGLGMSKVTISSGGEVYPCHMLVGNKEWYMGSVWEPDFPGKHFFDQRVKFGEIFDLERYEPCKSCNVRYLCPRCFAAEILYGKTPRACYLNKAIIDGILRKFAQIASDKKNRAKIVRTYSEAFRRQRIKRPGHLLIDA
jgi:uncharacterized protein